MPCAISLFNEHIKAKAQLSSELWSKNSL